MIRTEDFSIYGDKLEKEVNKRKTLERQVTNLKSKLRQLEQSNTKKWRPPR